MLISYVVIAMVCPMVLVVVKPKKLFLRSVLLWVVKVNFLNSSIMLKLLMSFQLIYLLLKEIFSSAPEIFPSAPGIFIICC